MGGVSPCMPNTQARAAALTTALETARIGEVEVFIAMRYWYPRARETARRVAAYRPDQVILLPLYPQYSTTTTASSLKAWEREARSEEHTSELQSLMRTSYAVFCLKKKRSIT